jgi:hypothetical protein
MSKFVGGSEGLRHALVNLAMFNEEIPTLHETKLAQLARKNGYAAPRAGRSSDGLITPRRATGPSCCACATSGHAKAVPPSIPRNSRRLMCPKLGTSAPSPTSSSQLLTTALIWIRLIRPRAACRCEPITTGDHQEAVRAPCGPRYPAAHAAARRGGSTPMADPRSADFL